MADIHRKEAFLRGWKSSLHLVCEVKLSWQKHFKHRSFLLLTLQEAAASAGPQSLLLHHHQQQQHQRRQPKTTGDRPRSATGFFEQQGKKRLSYFGEIDVDEINGGGGRRRISQGREGGGGGGPGSWVEATEEERSVSGSR